MESQVEMLSVALREAERVHAEYEKAGGKDEWPEFYAKYLLNNIWGFGHD